MLMNLLLEFVGDSIELSVYLLSKLWPSLIFLAFVALEISFFVFLFGLVF